MINGDCMTIETRTRTFKANGVGWTEAIVAPIWCSMQVARSRVPCHCAQLYCMVARQGSVPQMFVSWRSLILDFRPVSWGSDGLTKWVIRKLGIWYRVSVWRLLYHSVASLVDFFGQVVLRMTNACLPYRALFCVHRGRRKTHVNVNRWRSSVRW